MKATVTAILLMVALLPSLTAQSPSDPGIGEVFIHDASSDAFQFRWWAKAGEYYFVQQTEDLRATWNYFPYAVKGNDAVAGIGFTQPNAPHMFFRVLYTNDPASSLLTSDFDADNVPNKFELDNAFDPFDISDGNSNNLPDEWELFYDDEFGVFPVPLRAALTFRESSVVPLYLSNPISPDATFSISVLNNVAPGQIVYSFEDSLTGPDLPPTAGPTSRQRER